MYNDTCPYKVSSIICNKKQHWVVVVAPLEERLLLTPENPGSNPAISNLLPGTFEKLKIKKKDAGNGSFKNHSKIKHFQAFKMTFCNHNIESDLQMKLLSLQ